MKTKLVLIAISSLCSLMACQQAPNPGKNVETYLQAKVARDGATVRRLLCSDLADQYDTEVTTFEGVSNARIENMTCSRVGESDLVRCTGQIVADYGTESNVFPLGNYRIKQEDGEWKYCGESQ